MAAGLHLAECGIIGHGYGDGRWGGCRGVEICGSDAPTGPSADGRRKVDTPLACQFPGGRGGLGAIPGSRPAGGGLGGGRCDDRGGRLGYGRFTHPTVVDLNEDIAHLEAIALGAAQGQDHACDG